MPPLAGRSVLVIEDEALIAMLIDDLLRDAGAFTLGPVHTVGDALTLLQSIKPDVAVLDMNLAGLSAAPVADALAAMGIPFVVATGYSMDGKLRNHPNVPVLAKPFGPSELIATLAKVMSKDGLKWLKPIGPDDSLNQVVGVGSRVSSDSPSSAKSASEPEVNR